MMMVHAFVVILSSKYLVPTFILSLHGNSITKAYARQITTYIISITLQRLIFENEMSAFTMLGKRCQRFRKARLSMGTRFGLQCIVFHPHIERLAAPSYCRTNETSLGAVPRVLDYATNEARSQLVRILLKEHDQHPISFFSQSLLIGDTR